MASSFLPAPMHWPTIVISPIPTPCAATPLRFSRILVTAFAAIAAVPSVETVDWIASFPNWNMLFSIPEGIPIYRTFLIKSQSGRIV